MTPKQYISKYAPMFLAIPLLAMVLFVSFPDQSKAGGEANKDLKPYISLSSDTIYTDWEEEADSIFLDGKWFYPKIK